MRWKGRFGSWLALPALLIWPDALAGQTGSVNGTVRDSETAAPISGARVIVEGTNLSAVTDELGRYVLSGVPAGPQRIRAEFLGYAPTTLGITIVVGDTVAANLTLTVRPISLDQLVVTHSGEQQRRRELANAVAAIAATEITEVAPVTTLSNLMQGRAAGVIIQSSSGVTGTGSRIRIRGASSVNLNNAPLIYIDGARITSDERASTLNIGGQTVSRLDDLVLDEIESIEIVKGPSAATLYGTQAANGVIRITTKRGARRGAPQLNVWTELGVVQDKNTYPAVWRAETATGAHCPTVNMGLGLCEQAQVRSFNLLEHPSTRPFRTGLRHTAGANMSGSPTEQITFFVSGERVDEEGTLPNNEYSRSSFRLNLGFNPSEKVSLDLSSGYISSRVQLPNNDNSSLGIQGQGLLGGRPDSTGWWQFTPQQLYLMQTHQNIDRFTGSTALTWLPFTWLNLRASAGLDVVDQFDTQFIPPGEIPRGRDVLGNRTANEVNYRDITAEFNATAAFDLRPGLNSRTSFGLQYHHNRRNGVLAFGEQLVVGTNSLAAAGATRASEYTIESKTMGAYVQQQFGFNDRLFLTAALRGDDNSTFGEDFSMVLYPKLSASWVISEEPFFGGNRGPFSSVRLRAAFGQSGNQPGVTDALLYMRGLAVTTSDAEDAVGVTFLDGGLGNPELKPERSSEIEAGVDLTIGSRITVDVTLYDKRTQDALIFRNLPPSVGTVPGRWENLGKIRNRGIELGIDASLVQSDAINFGIGVQAARNTSKLVELGEGVAPLGSHREGYPLGSAWDRPILSFGDANGDGIVLPDDVVVDDEEVFLGTMMPPNQVTIQPRLLFLRRFTLLGLLEYQGGHIKNNNTGSFRCARANDRARNDPTVSLWEQARCVASVYHGTSAGYWEDASFMKLRELSLTLEVPESLTQKLGASRARLTLSGRNLATWTSYTGVDPEITRFAEDEFNTAEFLTQAPSRYWTARINLSF